MSQLLARILFCLLMLPLAVVVYCSTVLTIGDRGPWGYNGRFLFTSAGLTAWAFVAVYWTLLWRRLIRWNLRRRVTPVIVAFLCLLIGAVARFTLANSGDREGHLILLGITMPTLWLIATVYFWRETPAERAARLHAAGRANVACPACGYNLTGLTEARCPECGAKYTLDELMAAQPGAAAGEIE